MNIFTQYKGLRKENYILFFGRIATNLGSMIWPVLTLILNQKMGMNATQVAVIGIVAGIFMLPVGLLGGRLADRYSKKKCIIYCDTVSIIFYVICAFIPLSHVTIVLIVVAAACQSMEYPAYNALIADITYTKDRERAYSLQYLGANIGLVVSPTIAGILFAHHLWLAFLLCGLSIGVSTILIGLKVKDIEPVREEEAETIYQENSVGESAFQVLIRNKAVLLYLVMMGLYSGAYQQYGYLMPLDMGRLHGESGAVIYGSVSSLNCIVVVIFTPIFTRLFMKMEYTKKTLLGIMLLLTGYVVFLTMLGKVPAYYIAIILFTFGEILTTIANGPYLAERIPASHRGRINGVMTVMQNLFQGGCLFLAGVLYDGISPGAAWIFVFGVLALAIAGGTVLIGYDRKCYREMYM